MRQMPDDVAEAAQRLGQLGPMLLPFVVSGELPQALARVLVDRGHSDLDVIDRLLKLDEMVWWESTAGRMVDDFARTLGLEPFPADEKEVR
jgi:hypothetical protein